MLGSFVSPDMVTIGANDLGFGEFFPNTGKIDGFTYEVGDVARFCTVTGMVELHDVVGVFSVTISTWGIVFDFPDEFLNPLALLNEEFRICSHKNG